MSSGPLENGISKAAVCRAFEVRRSTLIDTLKRISFNAAELNNPFDNQSYIYATK
jgi:hypothetical protein